MHAYTIVVIKPLMNRNGVTNSGRRVFVHKGGSFVPYDVLGVELTKLQRERRVSTCSEYNELLPTQWIIKYGECDVRLCRADVLKIQRLVFVSVRNNRMAYSIIV